MKMHTETGGKLRLVVAAAPPSPPVLETAGVDGAKPLSEPRATTSPNGHPIDCECPSCDKYGAPWRRESLPGQPVRGLGEDKARAWQPIDTAPKDGWPQVVGRDMGEPWGFVRGIARWFDDKGISGWVTSAAFSDPPGVLGLAHPTHWFAVPRSLASNPSPSRRP